MNVSLNCAVGAFCLSRVTFSSFFLSISKALVLSRDILAAMQQEKGRYPLIYRKSGFMICFLFLVSATPGLFGQEITYKGSVYGGIGYGKFLDDEGSLGTGMTYWGGAEWRPLRRLGFDVELLSIGFRRRDAFRVEGDSRFVLFDAACYFSHSAVQPYLKGGAGFFRTRYTYSWPDTPVHDASKTGAALSAGAGIRFFLSDRWSLNPEFRVTAADGYFSLLGYASASLGYHW